MLQYLKRGGGIFLKSHIFALVAGLSTKYPLNLMTLFYPIVMSDMQKVLKQTLNIRICHKSLSNTFGAAREFENSTYGTEFQRFFTHF